ncbi:MAG: tetratricopeptide repeat protein [Phormidesmis sp. CAN_BIN44]|nr:tetratricopeptide repeat protein [Phormidesmis sp. CAN_BIN44]
MQLDVSDRVEKEVDRSYNRFVTQFNFALFLIGTSVWIFRQSVVDQLKIDVKKDVGESLKKELEEKIQEEVLLELSHTKEELKRTIEEQIQKESSEILRQSYESEAVRWEAVLIDDPQNLVAWVQRGRYLKRLGRFEEAIHCCDKAIKINPQYARAYYNKACYLSLQNEIKLVLQTLEQAISLDSRYRSVANRDQDFDLVRGDEQFLKLL